MPVAWAALAEVPAVPTQGAVVRVAVVMAVMQPLRLLEQVVAVGALTAPQAAPVAATAQVVPVDQAVHLAPVERLP